MKVLITIVLGYLIWALWHHRRDKSLTFAILLEYLLMAVLVLILLSGFLV